MIIVSCITLAAGVVSKGATFFIVSQVSSKSKQIPACRGSFSIWPGSGDVTVEPSVIEKVGWLWAIFFCFLAPELFTLTRCFRIVFMKSFKRPGVLEFLIPFIFETLHVLGTAILYFLAFPGMNSLRAIMATNAVAIVPGVLKILMKKDIFLKKPVHLALTGVAVLVQVSALIIWPALDEVVNNNEYDTIDHNWALPVGLLLTSFGWWECYVEEEGPLKKLWDIKTLMTDGCARGFIYFFISLWKILLFMVSMIIIAPAADIVPGWNSIFDLFTQSFETNEFILRSADGGNYLQQDNLIRWEKLWKSPALVILVQIACTWITYVFGKFACKCSIQRWCFALPISLVTPLCISTLAPLCFYKLQDSCNYSSSFPKHLFFECPSEISGNWFARNMAFMWLFFYLSHVWITFQIWIPKNKRLAETLQIFGTDYYNSLMIDTSMMLNRRTDDGERSKRFDNRIKHFNQMKTTEAKEAERMAPQQKKRKISAWSEQNQDFVDLKTDDQTVRIMGCATMWHENTEEIEEMLKSIFRIDDDYAARKIAFQVYNRSEDYYEWESHIFFDDCMTRSEDEPGEMIINNFVIDLITTVDKFGRKWYGKRGFNISMTKMATPYGGRLVWTLPGSTQIICHLKDKNKIRHKKR